MLHLKRWQWISSNGEGRCQAIHDAVSFQTSLTRGDKHYELRSVVVHRGAAYAGHFFCYVRSHDNLWFECDDEKTPQPVFLRDAVLRIIETSGYLFFYEALASDAASGAASGSANSLHNSAQS